MKRLRSTADWFRWMSIELIKQEGLELKPPDWLKDYKTKSVDASVITEPGSTGTDWRLHYSLNLYSLDCEQFIITKLPQILRDESFTNFNIQAGDLWIGDRAYGRFKGLKHIKNNGGEFITRMKNKAFTLYHEDKEFDMVKAFKPLKYGQVKEWDVIGSTKAGGQLNIRLCVIKKSAEQAAKSIKKTKKEMQKKQKEISPETLELCRYIIIVSSLPDTVSAKQILELYRYRWSRSYCGKLAFKRLKSLMGLGHLPKTDEQSCRAWSRRYCGRKIFVALLAQTIVHKGRLFSPWGYAI